jgi:hypothetical protein
VLTATARVAMSVGDIISPSARPEYHQTGLYGHQSFFVSEQFLQLGPFSNFLIVAFKIAFS